jgi:hypothetical protein
MLTYADAAKRDSQTMRSKARITDRCRWVEMEEKVRGGVSCVFGLLVSDAVNRDDGDASARRRA